MPSLIRFIPLLLFAILAIHLYTKQIQEAPEPKQPDAIIQQAASKQNKEIVADKKPQKLTDNNTVKEIRDNENQDSIIQKEQNNFQQSDNTNQSKQTHNKTTKEQSRTVQVSNNITQKMLGYKYFVHYYPNKFILTINDMPVEQDQTKNIIIKDNKVAVRYEYEFLHGMRKGAKITTFDIEPKADHLNITFSWDNEWRVIMADATPLEATKIEL